MTIPAAPSKTAGPIARRLDARWRRRVDYPVLGQHYRTSAGIDLLRSMRMIIRFTGVLAAAFLLILVLAFAGVSLPPNLHLLFILPALAIMFASTPNATSVLLWQVRPRWAQHWMDAGVQLTDLRLLSRSPLTPAQVRAYTRALGAAPDLGVDIRLVWALHERHITPETLNAYITALTGDIPAAEADTHQLARYVWRPTTGTPKSYKVVPTVEDVLRIADHYTPDEWALLRQANTDTSTTTLLALAVWASTSRATLDPSQFPDEATVPRRDVETTAEVLAEWMPYVSDTRFPPQRELCPEPGPLPPSGRCATCGTRDARDHGGYTAHPAQITVYAKNGGSTRSQRRLTMQTWAHACGTLAPHFIAGGFDFDTATNMCAQPTPPTVAMIRTLAALRN